MRGIRWLFLEAAFVTAYEVWVGPGYWGALAGELGVPWTQFAWVAALPWLGNVGQVLAVPLLRRLHSMKTATLIAELLGRLCWLYPFGAGALWGLRTIHEGIAFPLARWFELVAVCLFFSSLLRSAAGLAWKSWMQALIPSSFHGRFFGERQRWSRAGLLVANLAIMALATLHSSGHRVGPAIIAGVSGIAAVLSLLFLNGVPERRALGVEWPPLPREKLSEILRSAVRNRPFLKIFVVGTIYQGGVQLVMPYLGFYFTRELQIPLTQMTSFALILSLGAMLSAGYWGRRMDRVAEPKRDFLFISFLMALSSLLYVFLPREWFPWVAPAEFLWTGLLFSGFNVGLMKVLFATIPERQSPVLLALYFSASGAFGGGLAFVGGRFVGLGDPDFGFRILLLTGFGLRCGAVGLGYWLLPRITGPSQA